MSEVSSRLTLISLVPRQVMLEAASKVAATSEEDNYKTKKKKDKRMAIMNVEDEEKKSRKKSNEISEVSENVSGGAEDLAQVQSIGDVMSRNGMGREALLRSIAAFLEGSGFSKTLSVFLLEAKIEANNREGSFIDLENLFDKVIESSQRDPVLSIEWSKVQADAADDSNTRAKDKKRKSKPASDSIEEGNAVKTYSDAKLGTVENVDCDASLNVEKKKKRKELTSNPSFETVDFENNRSEKKKKKKEANQSLERSKLGVNQEIIVEKPGDGGDFASTSQQDSVIVSGNNEGEEGCLNFEEVIREKNEDLKNLASYSSFKMGEAEKNKGEKKKKKKNDAKIELGVNLEEVILENSRDGGSYTIHQGSVNSENIVEDPRENFEGRKKKKKNKAKKLEKSTSDGLSTFHSDMLVESRLDGLGRNDDNDVLRKCGFRQESIATSQENNSDVEKSTNKKRKRSSSKESSIIAENITAAGELKLNMSDVAKDKKKTEDYRVFTCSELAPPNQESIGTSEALASIILDKHQENPISTQKQLNGHQHANGNVKNHKNEGSPRTKLTNKEKCSGKPKEVIAFQRIKVDNVQFADERLQDNSYWALDDSGSGYGAKAQEVLGQVKGRGFRHEKTKKKRGTYRGGQIDLQSHSIKFNYSDDE